MSGIRLWTNGRAGDVVSKPLMSKGWKRRSFVKEGSAVVRKANLPANSVQFLAITNSQPYPMVISEVEAFAKRKKILKPKSKITSNVEQKLG